LTPKSSKFANEECGGVNVIVTDRGAFRPVATGVEIAYQLNLLHSGTWKVDDFIRLLVHRAVLTALKEGKTFSQIAAIWQEGLAQFARVRQQYLLY